MDYSTREDIKRAVKRTEAFMERAALMLHTGKNREPFPPNAEFSELELKSYESSLITLAVKLLRTPEIPENIWIPPVKFSYKYVENEKQTQWTWLERFYTGLKASSDFFNSFLSEMPDYGSYHIEVNNSTGVAISIKGSESAVEIINSLNRNEMETIANELETLRKALKEQSKTTDDDIAIAHVALAEKAAKENDKKGLVENLKKVGKWVFDVASKIGISVTAKLIGDFIKSR